MEIYREEESVLGVSNHTEEESAKQRPDLGDRSVDRAPVGRLDEQQLEAIEARAKSWFATNRDGRVVQEAFGDRRRLLAEVRALRAERDRLRDGIAAHRDCHHELDTDDRPLMLRELYRGGADLALWRLLGGEADDE